MALIKHQSISNLLANMAREIDAARLLCWKAAWMMDNKIPNGKEAAICKAYASEVAVRTLIHAIQIMGGYGCISGNIVEIGFRNSKVFTIGEGTSQIQRLIISRRILALSGSHADIT